MQTIYIVGGLAGMGKTSRIVPGLLSSKSLSVIEMDHLRGITTGLLLGEGLGIGRIDFEISASFIQEGKAGLQTYSLKAENKGEDYPAWFAALGLIKRIQNDVVIVGVFNSVILTPQDVRNFELARPEIKIKAAFVGYNKNARDTRPEKIQLKYDDYTDAIGGQRLKEQVQAIDRQNYRYFDLIQSVPGERSNQDLVLLEQADFNRNAELIIRYLLED